MTLEDQILNIAEAPNWYDSRELRAIALEVRKREDRIKQLEEMYEGVIGERPEFLGSNVMGLLKRELTGTQKRIKELEALNNQLCDTNVKVSQECDDLNVRVNKLEEENGAMRADLLLWKYQLEEERGKP